MRSPRVGQILSEGREQIVSRFVNKVQREDLPPPGLSTSLLVDHIPRLLDDLAKALMVDSDASGDRSELDAGDSARRHGEQRWKIGYELNALIFEFGVLRHCILATAAESASVLSTDDFDLLADLLNASLAASAEEYVAFRDEQLLAQKSNLEFLGEAGRVLSSSLDYRATLSRLTGLLVPRLADWCAVHLVDQDPKDMAIAHVDAQKVDVLREIYRRFPSPSDQAPSYVHAMRTGVSELVSSVDPEFIAAHTEGPEHLALVQSLNPRSFMIVPLTAQGTTFGALTFGYGPSGRNYSENDLALASELAGRAATAIDNARLFELSQSERSRAEAATRAKDEFVAVVSHELRTPLNAILGWIHLVRAGGLAEATQKRALEVIERNAEAQSRLLADLFDVSRVMTGGIRIQPAEVDLANVVEMAVEGLRPAADSKRIELRVDVPRDDSTTRGDSVRLQQLIWNLLTNAVKFTPKGGCVEVRLRRVESDMELVISDNGEGISPEVLPHIFEIFKQGNSSMSRSYGGMGLGLAITRRLVELHGGSVEARSLGVGHGATFTVRLPVSPLAPTTLAVRKAGSGSDSTDRASPPLRADGIEVIVVDDDPDARDLLSYMLQSSGMLTRQAEGTDAALTALAAHTPHVIISDIGMPGKDGYALIRSIRTLPSADKRDVPVIALTALAGSKDRTRALLEGFNMHMSKPVEPAELVQAVVDLAGSRAVREENRPRGETED